MAFSSQPLSWFRLLNKFPSKKKEIMLKNLLRIAFRNLKKDKGYSFLNILGLTIGITFSLFLFFYIKDELGFDKFNAKADRIFRINADIQEPDNLGHNAGTQMPLAPTLKKEYPEVEQSTRFFGTGRTLLKHGVIQFYEEKLAFADSTIFQVFSFPLSHGNPATALVEPHSVVLTLPLAVKYFGNAEAAMGQTLTNQDKENYKVTGVLKEIPDNSSLRFSALMSISSLPKDFSDNWGNFSFFNFVLLRPNVDPAAFEKKLTPMYDKYMAAIFRPYNVKIAYRIQPLADIHLNQVYRGGSEQTGSMSYIYIFGAVAVFMLVIACINYMNLTTARSARRAKEIGIRKVTGSLRWQLIAQFLVESTMLSLIALAFSVLLVGLLLPFFNQLSGKQIRLASLLEPGTASVLLAIVVFVGLLGGSYPALYLSRFNPIVVLKGSLSKGSSNSTLRRSLVVTQFAISMIMLICTAVVYGQLRYMRNMDLGFNKNGLVALAINAPGDIRSKLKAMKNDLQALPNSLSVSTASSYPGQGHSVELYSVQTETGYLNKGVSNYSIDEHFFKTMGVKMVKGRNFSLPSDTLNNVLVNENMVKTFGWKEAIGKRIIDAGDTSHPLNVIGVFSDFNQESLYKGLEPLLLYYRPDNYIFQVRIDMAGAKPALSGMEKIWRKYFPDLPFEYAFLDQSVEAQYEADQTRGEIFTAFSALTIFITCLGLLGLIAFTTEQRQKEISIRKIMGADTGQIVTLITRNFVLLVGLSAVIAFPVAWIFMNKWLEIFPYKQALNPVPFLSSALVVLLITLATVGYHSIRAAIGNPAKGLRSE